MEGGDKSTGKISIHHGLEKQKQKEKSYNLIKGSNLSNRSSHDEGYISKCSTLYRMSHANLLSNFEISPFRVSRIGPRVLSGRSNR
jgi:hypothetical protein